MPASHLTRLWKILDTATLWESAAVADELDHILSSYEQRLQRAQQAGVAVEASRYCDFLMRMRAALVAPALAQAG